jgi:hypothetical protein
MNGVHTTCTNKEQCEYVAVVLVARYDLPALVAAVPSPSDTAVRIATALRLASLPPTLPRANMTTCQ